jgi:polysaccharide export outer membrane protein
MSTRGHQPRQRHTWGCATGILLLLLGGCASATRFDASDKAVAPEFSTTETIASIPPEWLQPPREPFRLGVGDKVELEVLEVGGTRQACTVMPDGLIYYNLLPGLRVEGLTLAELRDLLTVRLAEHYRSPQVGVILRGVFSQRVWVMGRVNTPGLYPLEVPMTLIEAISRAGGLFTSRYSGTTEELADLRHSFFLRDGKFVPVDFARLLREGDASQNIYLRNGDYLYLPSALSKEVYVLGAVLQPKAIGYMDRVTLVSAIANAKDLLPRAQASRIVIVRGTLTQPKIAVVDYDAIIRGRAPDVVLQPRDIVWVPDSPWSNITEYAKTIVSTFVRTVAANEGARIAVPGATQVGVNINIGPAK